MHHDGRRDRGYAGVGQRESGDAVAAIAGIGYLNPLVLRYCEVAVMRVGSGKRGLRLEVSLGVGRESLGAAREGIGVMEDWVRTAGMGLGNAVGGSMVWVVEDWYNALGWRGM